MRGVPWGCAPDSIPQAPRSTHGPPWRRGVSRPARPLPHIPKWFISMGSRQTGTTTEPGGDIRSAVSASEVLGAWVGD